MTSKQIMLILWSVLTVVQLGCAMPEPVSRPISPYAGRRVFAVAPLRNESGSAHVDVLRTADQVTAQLSRARGLDTVPVNRVLDAMRSLDLAEVATVNDAHALRERLGVDGLVVGSVTAYDPYDPPTLGLALELYLSDRDGGASSGSDANPNPGELTRASRLPGNDLPAVWDRGPVTAIAGHYDASDPDVALLLEAYAVERGPDGTSEMTRRRYRISIDLYTEFVSYQLTSRLIDAERLRLRSPYNRRSDAASSSP